MVFQQAYVSATLTPILSGAVVIAATRVRGVSPINLAIGGAATGAIIAGAVEYTVNYNEHDAGTKWGVILGNMTIGAGATVASRFF